LSRSRLLELVKKKRRHAGFFHWPERRVGEQHIVQLFSEAAHSAGEHGLTEIASTVIDPPDCEALGPSGERVGIEVTELVDQKLAGQRPIKIRPKFWDVSEVVARINHIVRRKDLKCAHVTDFSKLILLVHTDEMFLRGYPGDEILEGLRAETFDAPNHFDEVVFMVSYDARVRTYPWVRLALSQRTTGQ
jgi:hypothetical protein